MPDGAIDAMGPTMQQHGPLRRAAFRVQAGSTRCRDVGLGRWLYLPMKQEASIVKTARSRNSSPLIRLSAISAGVRGYALAPESAKALWKKSEEMVGEAFA